MFTRSWSLSEPPPYPLAIDEALARRGRTVFNNSCADCHGTYGNQDEYPGTCIAIDELGTDRTRLTALRAENRAAYGKSWFAHFGKQDVIDDPIGYVAPPLDGIWASAPYFHNGSVPTLWHILHPQDRPRIWKRTEDGYDASRVGLEVEEFAKLPSWIRRADQLRQFFNTTLPGKSAQGHTFPDQLTESQKRAVLEYLKNSLVESRQPGELAPGAQEGNRRWLLDY